MSETAFIRSIIQYVDQLGLVERIRAQRLNAGLRVIPAQEGHKRRVIRIGEPGTPDIIIMLPGARVLWLETKSLDGTARHSQRAWHAMAKSIGQDVRVVRTMPEAITAIKEALRSAKESCR